MRKITTILAGVLVVLLAMEPGRGASIDSPSSKKDSAGWVLVSTLVAIVLISLFGVLAFLSGGVESVGQLTKTWAWLGFSLALLTIIVEIAERIVGRKYKAWPPVALAVAAITIAIGFLDLVVLLG